MGRVLIKNGYVITIDPRRRECRALCLKSALRLKRRDKEVQEKAEQRDHHRRRLGDSVMQSVRVRFSENTTDRSACCCDQHSYLSAAAVVFPKHDFASQKL
jgi:hypothetical protein